MKHIWEASSANDAFERRGLVHDKHVGDFLGVLTARELYLSYLPDYLVPDIFLH